MSPKPTAPLDDRLAFPIPEAAEALGIGPGKFRSLLATGEITSITIGRRRVVTRRALERYLDGREQDARRAEGQPEAESHEEG